MEIVLVQACADKYSHTPLVPQYYRFEGDFSKQDLASTVQHAKSMFAAKHYSAMLRGKQVVVAGDSQQLRPTDLYQARLTIEEEDIALEVESLLDLS